VESENDLDGPEQGLALINDGCRGGSAQEAVTLGLPLGSGEGAQVVPSQDSP
jgi:hypothetical protein